MDYIGMREDLGDMQYRLSIRAYEVAGQGDYLLAYHLQQLEKEAVEFFNQLLDRIPRPWVT